MILGVFAGVALVALTVNLLLLKFLKTLGMKDQPGKIQVRWSAQSKPTIGGISFFVGFLVLMVVLLAGYPAEDGTLPLLLAATLAFFAGLLDDAFNTKPFMKFLFQSACAMVLIAGGWVIDLDSPPLSWVITFLWITGLMNSINMLDNMDGISSITAMCIFLGLFLLGENTVWSMLAAGMIFVLIGFLPVNWNPSKVFMGDSGSQLLGLLLAALSIKLLWNNPVSNADEITRWISVIALFAVTLTDSLLVTINRLRHKKSPFVGGRDHSTHNLSYYSISDASIALIYTGWGLLQVILVWQLLKNPVDGFLKWEGFVLVWLVVIFISFYQISRTNLKRGKFKY